MTNTRERYIVKRLTDGFGVYDTERGSFPIKNPTLLSLGIDRLEFSKDRAAQEAIAARLNGSKDVKPTGYAINRLEDMAASLIADQAGV